LLSPLDLSQDQILDWFLDPAIVVPRLEKLVDSTFWGGEALPVVFPVSTRIVAVLAAYLGCPYQIVAGSNSGGADSIIDDWGTRPRFQFDPHNEWCRLSAKLLDAAARRAPGRFYVGLPDLNGPGEILARLQGTELLALDLIDHPDQVKAALHEVNAAWLRYWQASVGVIHHWVGGYMHWFQTWSDRPSTDLQCDFSCLISTPMFEESFLPAIEQQTQWVERTLYRLDGPGAVRRLDSLLSLPLLDGIQWIPGAGSAPPSRWILLLRRTQAKGKLVWLVCEPWEVEALMAELEPEGLLMRTHCPSEAQTRELIDNVARWTKHRQARCVPFDDQCDSSIQHTAQPIIRFRSFRHTIPGPNSHRNRCSHHRLPGRHRRIHPDNRTMAQFA
jgi:hypothetical protein